MARRRQLAHDWIDDDVWETLEDLSGDPFLEGRLTELKGHRLVAAAHKAAFRFHDEGGAAPSHTLTALPCHAAPKCMARPPAPCYAPAAR